jgi:hypothetical protein
LSWQEGSVLSRFDGHDCTWGELISYSSVRLLADGRGLVVADSNNGCVCTFTLDCTLVRAVGQTSGLVAPFYVLEGRSSGDSGFVVVDVGLGSLAFVPADGDSVDTYDPDGCGDDNGCSDEVALAALPDGGLLLRDPEGGRLRVFKGLALRFAWIAVCLTVTSS